MTVRLLVVSQYWAPAELAGGARSTGRAVAAVREDVETWVVTGDRDVGDASAWLDLPASGADGWVERDGIHVRYQRWDRGSGRRVRAAIDELAPDVIYLPSLFAPGSLAVLWRRAVRGIRHPVIVAPEGELHPGALAHHCGRKQTVLALLRTSGTARSLRWRAVDEDEAASIRRLAGPRASVEVAPDLHDAPAAPPPPPAPKNVGRARAAFVGSIVPKKGLHRALELLWPHRDRIELDVYGPVVDEGEWARCREVLDRAPGTWRVHGAVAHDRIPTVLASADVLVLPTLGENYGYVIAEALAAGCPVLISDQTPWRGLAADGCGWDLPLDDRATWDAALVEVVGWDDDDRRRVRAAALDRAARERIGEDRAADAWRRLFTAAATPATGAPGSTMRR